MLRLKQVHYKFQSYGSARHRATNVFAKKYILISRFLVFLEVKVLRKVLGLGCSG